MLSGSIADSICFFEPKNYDQEKIQACAQLAAIDQDIMAMSMVFNSLIGGMGITLSGGQKQRKYSETVRVLEHL